MTKEHATILHFGRHLARLRVDRQWTQEYLAEKAAIHPRYLQKLEAGVTVPSLLVLARLRAALELEWNEFLQVLR